MTRKTVSLSKPIYDQKFLEEVQASTAEYSNVFEERSSASTTKLPLEIEFRKKSNENIGGLKSRFNNIVINDLFIGCTLIGKYGDKIYEAEVSNKGKFIYNGEEYDSLSRTSVEIKGTSTDNGWDFFHICFDPKEGDQSLSYHRYQYFHNTLRKNDLKMYNLLLPCFKRQPRKRKKNF